MTDWIRICALDDIPRLGARAVKIADKAVAVFRTADDAVFALNDRCPHKAGPLSQGIVHGETVTCPLHGMQIALETGTAVAPDVGQVGCFQVRVGADGTVSLNLAERPAHTAACAA